LIQALQILTINSGSSSIKFALFEADEGFKKIYAGNIERIGVSNTLFSFTDYNTNKKDSLGIDASDFEKAADFLIQHLSENKFFDNVQAVGHRIVHGMNHPAPTILNEGLLKELQSISNYDPDHLPAEILLIEKISKKYPELMQVACFDTSFHATMPDVAKMFALPRHFYESGIKRYGFHGISYQYLLEEIKNKIGENESNSRIIMAHLGSGASVAALIDGKSVDTSMGFTPTGGTVMGTRSGDLDPGVAWYMMEHEKMNAEQFSNLINHESGLLGVSGISADMQDLLQQEKNETHAAEAVSLFCYHIKKWMGAFAAILNGLDILIFSGGIGENAPIIRSRICDGLNFLGIEIDEEENEKGSFRISTKTSSVKVYVIKTNEELMIAKSSLSVYKSSEK
jgi:acetate kinase